MVPVITSCGGHANKFLGDGLLCVFGAPERLSDHADRALDCALKVTATVDERFGGDVRIGIGLNSGPVVVGSVGGGGRLEFSVIGDPVNVAARVESVTSETGDTILITEAHALPARELRRRARPAGRDRAQGQVGARAAVRLPRFFERTYDVRAGTAHRRSLIAD